MLLTDGWNIYLLYKWCNYWLLATYRRNIYLFYECCIFWLFYRKIGGHTKNNFINIEIGVLKSILFENLYIYISFLKLFIEFDTFRTILISFKMNKGILHIFGQKNKISVWLMVAKQQGWKSEEKNKKIILVIFI